MRKNKKLFSTIISIFTIVTMLTNANALVYANQNLETEKSEEIVEISKENLDEDLDELNRIYNDIDINIIDDETFNELDIKLEFDTIEEFDKFIEEHQKNQQEEKVFKINIAENNDSNMNLRSLGGTYYHTFDQRMTILGGYNAKMNIGIEYEWYCPNPVTKQKCFKKVTYKSTWLTGFNLSTWNERRHVTSISSSGTTLNGDVNGEITMGISVQGFKVGYTYNEHFTYQLFY